MPADKQKGKSKKKQVARTSFEARKPAGPEHPRASIYRLVLEKIPLLALAIVASVITYLAEQKEGAIASMEAFPLGVRIGNAFISYATYLIKMVWPNRLAVFYPHPGSLVPWQVWGSVLFLLAVTLAMVWLAGRFPYLAVGWFWYAGTLVPVIGLVQIGNFAMADRYTYLPLVGLFIMVAWVVPEILKPWRYRKETLLAWSSFSILGLCVITWTQAGYWQNSIVLFDHTLQVTDDNCLAYNNRGLAYKDLGNYGQAVEDYDRAIEINPRLAKAYNNRGLAYKDLGDYNRAIEDFNRAIDINPRLAEAYSNRGAAYGRLGHGRQAIEDLDRAIEISPGDAKAYINRGAVYGRLGHDRQAIEDLDRAIEISPGDAKAYINRGAVYGRLGHGRQAIEDFNRAIEIDPRLAEAYNNRGAAYTDLGHYRQAIEDLNSAIRINQNYAEAYNNRAAAYNGLGDQSRAIKDLKTAARLGSENAKNLLRHQGISW